MAATTAPTTARTRPVPAQGGGFGGALAAEWIKLRGLRSTWTCIGLTLAMAAGIALLGTYTMVQNGMTGMDANALTPTVIMIPQFALITLAALLITGEYATGSIRTTLTTVPRRGSALAAKGVILSLVALTTGALVGLLSALITIGVAGSDGITTAGLTHGIGGTAAYSVAVSLFVLGLGAALRSTAGTVATTIAVVMGIPMIATLVGNEVLNTVSEYSPTSAGMVLIGGGADPYGWPVALMVLVAWACAAVAAGYALLRGRDA
ncbi:ABC-2 type transport system permease protein [Murinocardiopsis flavida]|uniref:ABC-2 type transport system permease protein n=1 Tax=Murinocardiopsis flavida TaxID=645275 RepID=A0A2P8DGY8_9ACTN|nr:ABC transporter permease subunit [Murinocardiopsis flavida]PSK96485.1 ABC-2 type transport system permease protein [Murinocardiopsis flavida]